MRLTVPLTALAPLLALACAHTDANKPVADTDVVAPNDTSTPDTSDVVDTDAADTDTQVTTGDTDDPLSFPTGCTAPAGLGLQYICDLSVNRATATPPTAHGAPLILDVRASSTPPPIGGFNGSGRGSRAIAGFHGYGALPHMKLSDLTEISFDATKISGSYSVEIGLQVDLTCDNNNLVYLTVVGSSFEAPVSVGGHDRYRAQSSQALWHAQGGLADPSDPHAPKLLFDPGDLAGTPQSLSATIAAYPDACLRNYNAGFRDLPHGFASSGVLLTLGSSVQYLQRAQWQIYRVQINDDVLLPP